MISTLKKQKIMASLGRFCRHRNNMVMWLILAALTLAGCAASGAAGRLQLSTAVSKDFESATVLPDHSYYTTGSEMNPDAVIAIHKRFTLVTDRWRAVSATEKNLKDWVNSFLNLMA